MASKTFSFRLTNAEVELLESFQDPHGETLNQTAARLLREVIGASTANTTVSTPTPDRETVRDEIDSRTAYLATAMNEIKAKLEDEIEFLKTRVNFLEQNQAEKPESTPVTTEATEIEIALPMLQEKESAIAPKATEENITLAMAGNKEYAKKLKSVATSIQNTFRGKGIEISQTIIKSKIVEMYPNSDDWKPYGDARKDVTKALERELK